MESTKPLTSSGKGGARPGAGRPPGSMSKLAKEAREAAARTGLLPHEFLLQVSRGEPVDQWVKHPTLTDPENPDLPLYVKSKHVPSFEQRSDAAKAAAPYYAPKISTVELISGVSDDDLDSIIAGAAAQAGISLGPDGEGTQDEATSGQAKRTRVAVGDGT